MGIGNETALKGAFALDLGSASESTRSKTRPGIGIDFGTGGTAPASVRGTGSTQSRNGFATRSIAITR